MDKETRRWLLRIALPIFLCFILAGLLAALFLRPREQSVEIPPAFTSASSSSSQTDFPPTEGQTTAETTGTEIAISPTSTSSKRSEYKETTAKSTRRSTSAKPSTTKKSTVSKTTASKTKAPPPTKTTKTTRTTATVNTADSRAAYESALALLTQTYADEDAGLKKELRRLDIQLEIDIRRITELYAASGQLNSGAYQAKLKSVRDKYARDTAAVQQSIDELPARFEDDKRALRLQYGIEETEP